jgi:hypothetical protein
MATTPYPFVANAILTASQLNSTFNIPVSAKTASYVLTAADAGTRITMSSGSSTTITVNTSLFAAGDNLEITNIGAGVCTITAGTATVSTSGTLALVANAGGTLYFTSAGVSVFIASGVAASSGGLTFISSTSFTTAASVSLPVGTFSATYLNYLVLVNLTAASTDINLTGRMRIAGADNTTSSYTTMLTAIQGDATVSNVGNASQSSFTLRTINSTPTYAAKFDFINPFATALTHCFTQISSVNPGVAAVGSSGVLIFGATTSFDSFSIIGNTGTITGTVKVYGYANS